jgi:hypothetical protein
MTTETTRDNGVNEVPEAFALDTDTDRSFRSVTYKAEVAVFKTPYYMMRVYMSTYTLAGLLVDLLSVIDYDH